MKRWSWGIFLLGGLAVLPARGSAFVPTPADLNRALVLSQLGLQDAEAQLKATFPFRTFDNPGLPKPYKFWGSDATETLEPPFDATLEAATNPSFAVEQDGNPATGSPAPRPVMVGGAVRGFSGVNGPGLYAANGDQYALRVSDLSGRIYINDGVPGGASGSVSQNLKRVLNALGTILAEPTLGDRILANRPVSGYASLNALVPVLGDASFRKVRNSLTAHAWVDPNVANPVPLSSITASRYPVNYYRGTPAVFRFGSSVDSSGAPVTTDGLFDTLPQVGSPAAAENHSARVFGLDSLNAQWVEIVGRAPVNINAASREVLMALLADLKGFYVSDRKRNNPRWSGDLYLSFKLQTRFSPTETVGSEVGFLMETYPIVLSGPGIPAQRLADEIIACRMRRSSTYVNYATKPWGGPFKSWHQFNLFVDNLVTVGAIADPRASLHVAHTEEGTDPTGFSGAIVPDATALQFASQAIADVIKANFNPNLHLNELNPDENLYLRVDKTDLIVNSTEFAFIPTGYFEVESLGRVVRPTGGEADALSASDNQVMAQAKLATVIKLYNQYRETSQKQFYAGTASSQTSAYPTSNGLTLEVGPEPDNGVFPGNLGAAGSPDNEWDGYIALPTNGGIWHGGPVKAKNTLATTMNQTAVPHLGAGLHVHYTLDGDACHSVIDRQEIAGRTLAEEEVVNHPDYVPGLGTLPYGGPYDPTKGQPNYHRLAKSFRLGGGPNPPLTPFAPSDLRVDGAYAERHSAPAYYMHKGTNHFWNFNTETNARGTVSFWIKPSFYPELTGKVRKFWDMSRFHDTCGQNVNVWPFEMVYMPVNYNTGASESGMGPKFWHNNIGKFEPSSIYFGSQQWHGESSWNGSGGHAFGRITSCLNHLGHADHMALKPSPMRGHRWMNTTFSWSLFGSDASGMVSSKMWINGTEAYTRYSYSTMTGWPSGQQRMMSFDKHCGGAYNHMRLGGTSRVADAAVAFSPASQAYRGNYSSDATVDELYVWQDNSAAYDLLWTIGRYYNVRRDASNVGTFTSQSFSLPPAPSENVRILGAAWTWYGEESDPFTGDRVVWNYGGSPEGMPNGDLGPRVSFSLLDGAVLYGPLSDDGFSPVQSVSGQPAVMGDPSQLKYVFQFGFNGGTAGSILLGTPVLDDVTIYWSDGAASTAVGAPTPVLITGPGVATLPDADYGQPYTATFTASGASPITWTVSSGSLPSGMSLDPASGVLSGTPASGGTYTFVITATHGADSSGAQYTLTVTGAPSGGGGCGFLGLEAALLAILLRARRR